GGAHVGGGIADGQFETDAARIGGMMPAVVQRQHEAVEIGTDVRDGLAQIGREGGDAALPRQVIPEDCNTADGRFIGHEIASAQALASSGTAMGVERRGGIMRYQRGTTSRGRTNSKTWL